MLWRSVYVDGHALTSGPAHIAYARRSFDHKRSKDQFARRYRRTNWSAVVSYIVPERADADPQRVKLRRKISRDQWETEQARQIWEKALTTAQVEALEQKIESAKEEIIGVIVSLHGHPADEAEQILEDEETAA
jgi:hypothetical protein